MKGTEENEMCITKWKKPIKMIWEKEKVAVEWLL